MHACLWADLYLCLSLLLHLPLSLSFFLYIYIYFTGPKQVSWKAPTGRLDVSGREPESNKSILSVTEPGLGSAMAVLVSMVEDVVVVAAPALVLAIPPCGIASSLAAIFVYSTLYSILRK